MTFACVRARDVDKEGGVSAVSGFKPPRSGSPPRRPHIASAHVCVPCVRVERPSSPSSWTTPWLVGKSAPLMMSAATEMVRPLAFSPQHLTSSRDGATEPLVVHLDDDGGILWDSASGPAAIYGYR